MFVLMGGRVCEGWRGVGLSDGGLSVGAVDA
jgi:hypothetical protein